MSELLRVRRLHIDYPSDQGPIHAVRELSFSVSAGSVSCIVGESGSGKSAACRAIMRIIEQEAQVGGRISFDGIDLTSLSPPQLRRLYATQIAMLPQSIASLNPLLTVEAHIAETLRAHTGPTRSRGGPRKTRARALDLLEQFHLDDASRVLRARPHELSGGMKQRVLMAITFACDPRLVVADEPTKGLDLLLRDEVIGTLRNKCRESGAAMLIVTHDLEVAASLADTVGVVYAGMFLEAGPAREVFGNPRHPYTRSLLASLPRHGLQPTPGFAPSALCADRACPFAPRCPRGGECDHVLDLTQPFIAGDIHVSRCPYR